MRTVTYCTENEETPSANFDFNLHALRRITYTGVTFRTRTRDDVRALNAKLQKDVQGLLGDIKLPIAGEFSLSDASRALEVQSGSSHFGKVILVP